ncbi:N-acyl-D-amino-acid deacylase family protein [Flagellimonas abyssi]|uniref:Amidohydrolase family protein n=1 Tax=Flagellimonas abyssi TaxID=2864871 RepID=A0ABS7EUA7_9FLAO|nr:amidohydrolase family protein [Allomuricauda abyssi]MBW8201031.1 amidohydrolase family protein [Allomuricauda abyssi]
MKRKFLGFMVLVVLLFSCKDKSRIKADILIVNGTVYDGVGSQPRSVAIAIKDDKIVWLGDNNKSEVMATKTIKAQGFVVSPGFIDPHTHATNDLDDPEHSHNKPFLFQGVTTVTIGNDGSSPYPLSKYREACEKNGVGTNVVTLVGHGTIRKQVMGESDRQATQEELEQMKYLMQQELNTGAFGMSTGLFYAPGSYATTDEVVELAKVVAKNNGFYDTHMRDESTYSIGLIPAVQETIEIGERANIPVHISHIKCLGVDVWKQSDSIIKIVETAQQKDIDITANQYPYNASATSLKAAVVPRWAESGGTDSLFIRFQNPALRSKILEETQRNITRRGGADKLLVIQAPDTTLVGKNVLEIAEDLGKSPENAVFDILKTGYIKIASFNMNSYDIENFMVQPWVVTGSDGGSGHPRKYGTFPYKYRKFVKQDSILNMASFINRSSSKTAEILKLSKRGTIQEGNYADIIIFDPKNFTDKADYMDAFQISEGVIYSIINGKLSIENGKFTKKLNGKVLQP